MLFLNSENFWQNIKRDRYLLLALALAFILRTTNPTFGSPSLYISNDEAIAHLSALNMIAQETPISIANYTPLGAYIQIPFLITSFFAMKILGLVNNAADFELFLLTHEGYFLFIPRLISGLFGSLTIFLIFKITRELFKERRIAICAAFLSAVSFNLVQISHFGRPWAPALFFMALGLFLVLKNRVFLSYSSIAIAFGFHQVGLFFLPLLFLMTKRKISLGTFGSIILSATLMIFFSSLTLKTGVIESILNGQSFIRTHVLITDFLAGNFDIVDSAIRTFKNNIVQNFIVNLFLTDGVIFIFAMLGIFKYCRANNILLSLTLYFLIYFLFAALFFHPLVRYLLPLWIILIPFAARSISNLKKTSLIIGLILVASINSVWWNILYSKIPTFIQARDWIQNNIPDNVSIAFTGNRYRLFVPSSEAIKITTKFENNFYKRLASRLSGENADNVRNIVYVSYFPGKAKLEKLRSASREKGIVYVVDYYLDPQERLFLEAPDSFEVIAKFYPREDNRFRMPELLFDTNARFPAEHYNSNISKFSLARMGPYFEILKVKNFRF